MKHAAFTVALAMIAAQPAAAEQVAKTIAARIEAIPVQTLTISDEQFLKGDAYGRLTTIAGVLRVAQGTGRLPVVIFAAGSGGFGVSADIWDRQFEEMGVSTFAMDSFAGRGITSTATDQSQLGRLNPRCLPQHCGARLASAGGSRTDCGHGILPRWTSGALCEPKAISADVESGRS
jgi:hypothetical protein